MTLCVYAITGRGTLSGAPRGVERERLRLVSAGPVAAVVGELRRRPRPTREVLERFDAIVRRLFERCPALLPARFGSCFSSAEELELVLRLRGQSLAAALARLRGRAQMTIRLVPPPGASADPDPDAFPRATDLAVPDPGSPIPDPGVRYLRARAARELAVPGLDPVRAAVRRFVRAERVERRGSVASVYHLVPRGSAASYARAANLAARSSGLRMVVTGPHPPYAFSGW